MYWFKGLSSKPSPLERGLLYTLCFIALLSSCKPEIKETKGELKFFDLKGYFKADSARLSSRHPMVTKTVMQNNIAQTKKVYIANWGREFELFENSDINRPAWRDSYSISTDTNSVTYEAKSPDLKTRKIVIQKNGNRIKCILIINHTQNLLYESTEKLSYCPDSAYQIDKAQKVRLLGENVYSIKGLF
ncbi:MAG: hypothetical protein V4592_12400 [Bacteroidota bacterium]